MNIFRQSSLIVGIVAGSATFAFGQADPVADLTVEKTAPEQTAAGANVAFDVTMRNNGPDPAVNAVVVDMVPAGTTFVSAVQNSGPAFTCTAPVAGSAVGSVSCTCPSLGAGAVASFTFVFHIDPTTAEGIFITNVAAVATETFDPNEENNSGSATTQTPPPPVADMRVAIVGPGGANPDSDVTYTIELSNGGPGAATIVQLEDTIPGDMTIVSITQTAGPTLTCSDGTSGTVSCTVATFPAGATASLTVIGHVPPGTGEGTTYSNFATVTSNFDPNVENDAATTLVCVQDNSCLAGACNQNRAVVCAAIDQCHAPGTCSTVTGACSASLAKPLGTACDDANACTQSDSCQAAGCTGGNPVVCPAPDQCHTQGSCDTGTGTCAANPPKSNGAACNDGNGCTQADTCQAGVCTGASPVVCAVADQCHTQGTCNPTTGTCAANPSRTNGAACNDGNACTQTDSCQAGVCAGASPIVCPVADQCHTQGTCDTATGTCAANAPKTNGVACNDGNACTQTDSCQVGLCRGTTVSCDDGNACTVDTCDPGAGCMHTGMCVDAGVDAEAGTDADTGDAPAETAPGDAVDANDVNDLNDARPDGADADAARPETAPTDARDVAADVRLDGLTADARPDVADVRTDGRDADTRPSDATDARPAPSSSSGCGCFTAGTNDSTPSLAWLLLLGVFAIRRRRPRRQT